MRRARRPWPELGLGLGLGLWCAGMLGCSEPALDPALGPPPANDEEDPQRVEPEPIWLQAAEPVADVVVIVSIDGLAPGPLEPMIEAGRLPAFARLQREGAWTHNARTDPQETNTLPNHIGMVTGRPTYPEEGVPETLHHGYSRNGSLSGQDLHTWGNEALTYIPSIFDVAHDQGMRTGLLAGKTKLEFIVLSYDEEHGAVDEIGPSDGRNKLDVAAIESDTDALVDAFISAWRQQPLQLSLVHLKDPDDAGHVYGWGSMEWQQAVEDTDQRLGRLLDELSDYAEAETETETETETRRVRVIVTSDHGGAASTHSDPTIADHYIIPMYVWGAGVPREDLYDALGDSRVDPGAARIGLSTSGPPLRNMDAANLALRWLGLVPLDVRPLAPAGLEVDPLPF